jgi:hypothetical protein
MAGKSNSSNPQIDSRSSSTTLRVKLSLLRRSRSPIDNLFRELILYG